MPNHLFAVDSNRHPPQGASSATSGQVLRADGSDVVTWVSFGGDVTGPPNNLAVIDLTIAGQTTGDLLWYNSPNWVRLAAGTNGYVLTMSGGAPVWAAAGGGGGIGGTLGATDNVVPRADGTGGSTLQASALSVDDSGNLTTAGTVITMGSAATDNLIVGFGAHGTGGSRTTILGHSATSSNADSTIIGAAASGTGTAATALGRSATAAVGGVAIGYSASAAFSGAIAIGRGATATAANQLVVGGASYQVTDVYVGQSVTATAPPATVTFHGTGGSGMDVVPSAVRIAAGIGTGNAVGSYLYLATSSPGSTGTTAQTLVDRALITGSATVTVLWIGNPDADNAVATPVATAQIAGTNASGSAQATDLQIKAGTCFSTGRAGDAYLAAGASVDGRGGNLHLVAGDSDNSTRGVLSLETRGDIDGLGVSRVEIQGNGEVDLIADDVTLPAHRWQRMRVTCTANGSAQTVQTWSIASGRSAFVRVIALWDRTAALGNGAIMELLGAARNASGTTDEIGGAAFTTTGTREGTAVTDGCELRIVGDNTSDELQVQLFKSNANDYQVDLLFLFHED